VARTVEQRAAALAAKRDRAALLSSLKDNPAWVELRLIYEERRARQEKILLRSLMSGNPVDQRYIDRMAGYLDGMKDLLDDPGRSEDQFRRALERAEREQGEVSE
jgi:hypothetical protein